MTPQEILAKVPPIRTSGSVAGLRLMMEKIPNGALIVEVGCYAGQSTEVLASKARTLICVDAWDPAISNICPPGVTMEDVRQAFEVRMAPWARALMFAGGALNVLRMLSVEAAVGQQNESLDLVYIDANHFYAPFCTDIRAWLPKVKPGGFIGGHDYNDERWRPEVNRAVDELLGKPDFVFPDCSWLKRIGGKP